MMSALRQRLTREERGFTLIELLIVIIIIGILLAVAVPTYLRFDVRAKDTRRATDLNAIRKALELYYQDNGYYPPATPNAWDLNSYVYSNDAGGWAGWAYLEAQLRPYGLQSLPRDPVNAAGCAPWNAGCFTYAYGNVSRYGSLPQYDLVAQLQGTDNPLRCAVKNYRFYFNNLIPWCGSYTSQIYDVSPGSAP